jgi:hypothetical protein
MRLAFSDMRMIVRSLSELVTQVKDEQGYIVVRERTHRNTAESTNARVKWWSLFQILILVGEGIFQVWWIKRFFEGGIPGFPVLIVKLTPGRLSVSFKASSWRRGFLAE